MHRSGGADRIVLYRHGAAGTRRHADGHRTDPGEKGTAGEADGGTGGSRSYPGREQDPDRGPQKRAGQTDRPQQREYPSAGGGTVPV